jgi:hypothetical protein
VSARGKAQTIRTQYLTPEKLSVRRRGGGVLGRAQRTGGAKRKATAAVRVKPKPVCNFFLRGVCKAGDACEYQHTGVPRTKSQLCKFWRSSPAECQKGDACPYAHDFGVEACKVRPRSFLSHRPTGPHEGAQRARVIRRNAFILQGDGGVRGYGGVVGGRI